MVLGTRGIRLHHNLAQTKCRLRDVYYHDEHSLDTIHPIPYPNLTGLFMRRVKLLMRFFRDGAFDLLLDGTGPPSPNPPALPRPPLPKPRAVVASCRSRPPPRPALRNSLRPWYGRRLSPSSSPSCRWGARALALFLAGAALSVGAVG